MIKSRYQNVLPGIQKAAVVLLVIFIAHTGYCQPGQVSGTHPAAENESKKVLIHYMGWYGDTIPETGKDDMLRHWKYGHANSPLIGCYDSKSESLLTYHILLSWSCGIDGIVINVKDDYDAFTMKSLIRTIQRIRSINSVNFTYDFGISYDDQGFDLASPYDTAAAKMRYLRDSILPGLSCYLKYQGRPAIFVFDYPEKFMTAKDLRNVLNEVFGSLPPLLIWNSLDDKENSKNYVDAFYPWVQPGNKGWDEQGLNWGKDYLDWYYARVNEINSGHRYAFTCGGVWPGFDDRENTSWGGNRLMSRSKGLVYDSTWTYILNYDKPLPLEWVVIETWNDWNEGTEIEPSMEDGYKYLVSTIKNINTYKGTNINEDTIKFEAAGKIYEASLLIERGMLDSYIYNTRLEEAIRVFLRREFNTAENMANTIINSNVNPE